MCSTTYTLSWHIWRIHSYARFRSHLPLTKRGCVYPDWPFHSFRISKSVDLLIVCCARTTYDEFWSTRSVKGSVWKHGVLLYVFLVPLSFFLPGSLGKSNPFGLTWLTAWLALKIKIIVTDGRFQFRRKRRRKCCLFWRVGLNSWRSTNRVFFIMLKLNCHRYIVFTRTYSVHLQTSFFMLTGISKPNFPDKVQKLLNMSSNFFNLHTDIGNCNTIRKISTTRAKYFFPEPIMNDLLHAIPKSKWETFPFLFLANFR